MALNDYAYIADKIRKITGRPSVTQMSVLELENYLNSFLVYDFPLYLRLFYNRTNYSFPLTPSVGTYSIDAFKNIYPDFQTPMYIDGFEIQFFQDSQSFFQMFSRSKYSTTLTSGNGTAGPYAGTFSYTPVDPGTVVISCVNNLGHSLIVTDVPDPLVPGQGTLVGNCLAGGTIIYATGVIANLTFLDPLGASVVALGSTIYISANNYVRGRPIAVLYFAESLKFWPYPDRAYTFQMTVYKNPDAADLTAGSALFPGLKQWADVIAFGTALKIFSDNLDMDNYQKAYPLFDQARRLTGRRTLTQLATQRVSTIYGDAQTYPWAWGYPYQ